MSSRCHPCVVPHRPLLDLRVSVRGGVHFDLVKRVLRDINRSGQAPEEIIQQISDTVYPMYKVRNAACCLATVLYSW